MDEIQINMKRLCFVFFKMIKEVEVIENLRVSTWLENNLYLMPCQFTKVRKEENFYSIQIEVLDPDSFIEDKYIEKKFFFGHPGKIIGYGILKEIIE